MHVNKGWLALLPTALLTFGLLFWDWVPTFVVHRYYCATEGRFTVNKTLAQWQTENFDIADTLVPIESSQSIKTGNTTIYPLNQRFNWQVIQMQHSFHIHERDERIVDTKTNDVLVRYIDFDSNPFVTSNTRFRDYKT